jgi:hypothetical protein
VVGLAKRKPHVELRCRSAILDGEIVALDRHGTTQFQRPVVPWLRFVRQGVCGFCIRDLALPDYLCAAKHRT